MNSTPEFFNFNNLFSKIFFKLFYVYYFHYSMHSAPLKWGDILIEPVHLTNFFIVFLTAALILVFGAIYALLFTFAKINKNKNYLYVAYLAYGALSISIFFLAIFANLVKQPFWIFVVVLMLIGYFFAPQAIWKLCVATHQSELINANDSTIYL